MYEHGIYVSERATSMSAAVTGTAGLTVVVGTAPVSMVKNPEAAVNKPILVSNYKEAAEAVGYSEDFEKYTICEAVSAAFRVVGAGPLVLLNVLDPKKHNEAIAEKTIMVNDGIAVLEEQDVIEAELKVKNGEVVLENGTDYMTALDADGMMNIIVIPGGKAADAQNLKVSGKRLAPEKVTAADIVGGIDAETGEETGLEAVRQVYPKLGMVPGILIAPRFSMNPIVAAALQAKTKGLNGVFKCVAFVDVNSEKETNGALRYTDVKAAKEKQALTDENTYLVWLFGKTGDMVYSGSSLAAALTAYTDAMNDDTPSVSPSNKTLAISAACLPDGTEVILDQEQANTVNSFGVATFLNMNGFRLWGNNTAAYPGNTDPKDRWLSVRRFFNWSAATFIMTYFQKVDSVMNKRLVEAIVDSENVRGNGFVARGVCAKYSIEFLTSENTTEDLISGRMTFCQSVTPYTPAECIKDFIEFDPKALAEAFA